MSRWRRAEALILLGLSLLEASLRQGEGAGQPPGTGQPDLSDVVAIVALGAGVESYGVDDQVVALPREQSVLNAFEAARLYRLKPMPVIASGGIPDPETQRITDSSIQRDLLLRAGVTPADILLESTSRTTHEQAEEVAKILRARGWTRVALVTSPAHLPRAVPTFRAQGIDVVPAAARFRSNEPQPDPVPWLPSGTARKVSYITLYDYMGWVYYKARGWM